MDSLLILTLGLIFKGLEDMEDMKIEEGFLLSNGADFQCQELREMIPGKVIVGYQHKGAFAIEKRAEGNAFNIAQRQGRAIGVSQIR